MNLSIRRSRDGSVNVARTLPLPQSPQRTHGRREQFPNFRRFGCLDKENPESRRVFSIICNRGHCTCTTGACSSEAGTYSTKGADATYLFTVALRTQQEQEQRCGAPQRAQVLRQTPLVLSCGTLLELFQLKVSVDQDLTVVVVALHDDVVKQWLVSIVFHASVTKQRSNGSEKRFSRSHLHEKKQNPP